MDGPDDPRPVLVTGGTGFIATYCIAQLLGEGYRVRTTLRSIYRRPDLIEKLAAALVDYSDSRLEFVEADLTADQGWAEAAAGCGGVLHVASPFPAAEPKDPDEVIIPAVDGTLRVLTAAHQAGVDRVVLTSSFAAIGYGHPVTKTHFTEADWSVLDADIGAYAKSKTLAEQAAWEYAGRTGLELAVINPVAVFGPVLGPDFSTSMVLLERMLAGRVPGLPKASFGIVDVHDVAALHIAALTTPAAAGERFIAMGERFWTLKQMAKTLREGVAKGGGSDVRTLQIPNFLVKAVALVDSDLKPLLASGLGHNRLATSQKAQVLFDWQPMPDEVALLTAAESLIELRKDLADEPM